MSIRKSMGELCVFIGEIPCVLIRFLGPMTHVIKPNSTNKIKTYCIYDN